MSTSAVVPQVHGMGSFTPPHEPQKNLDSFSFIIRVGGPGSPGRRQGGSLAERQ